MREVRKEVGKVNCGVKLWCKGEGKRKGKEREEVRTVRGEEYERKWQ